MLALKVATLCKLKSNSLRVENEAYLRTALSHYDKAMTSLRHYDVIPIKKKTFFYFCSKNNNSEQRQTTLSKGKQMSANGNNSVQRESIMLRQTVTQAIAILSFFLHVSFINYKTPFQEICLSVEQLDRTLTCQHHLLTI